MPPPAHGYTLEALVADSGRLPERSVLRLVAALSVDAEAKYRAGGLARGLVAADVVVDGEPEAASILESAAPDDPRRLASLAPEAAEGGGRAPESAIVFSLGLIAFHALSGAPAFRAPGEAAKRAAPVFELRAFRVSDLTLDLVRRATSRDPRQRPRKLRKLRKAAERVIARTRWDGDRAARRAPRPSIALPGLALAAAASVAALFWFRVGPFQIERVVEGFARILSDPAPAGPGGDEPTPRASAGAEGRSSNTAGSPEVPAPEKPPAGPPAVSPPEAVRGGDDFLLPRAPSPEDEKLYREAMDKLAAARRTIETSAFDSGEGKFASLREAMSLLESARSLLGSYGEAHPEKRPTVERRMVEINQELMFCRKLLPSRE